MASRSQSTPIPISKLTANGLGFLIVGGEVWLNVEFLAQSEGWVSSPVFITAIASATAAAAPIFAERALKARHWAKLSVLMLGFLLMAAYSFGAGIDRIGTKRDNEAASARSGNERVKLDREAYDMAKQAKEAECTKNPLSKRCRTAEEAVKQAGERLRTSPVQRIEDHMAARITAVMSFVSAEEVATYFPLLLPGAFQLLGFGMLAFGFSPKETKGETELGQKRRNKGNRKPKDPKRTRKSNAEYQRDWRARQKAKLTIVK